MGSNSGSFGLDYLLHMQQDLSRFIRTLDDGYGNSSSTVPRPNADEVIVESRGAEQADQPAKKHVRSEWDLCDIYVPSY